MRYSYKQIFFLCHINSLTNSILPLTSKIVSRYTE
jgi:hypothetical protein